MSSRSVIETSGKKVRTKNISSRVRKIVISPIKEMSILADAAAQESKTKIISFGQGIPYWDTPDNIKRGIVRALNKIEAAKYTLEPGITELRELVAKNIERSRRVPKVSKEEVMITVGCQEAVDCAIATVIDPGEEILLPEPAFASHIEQIIQFGGVPKFVPLREKNGWHLSLGECARRITKKTRAVLISNPSNPTGMVYSKSELTALSALARRKNLVIIADETYDFLTYGGAKHFSPASIPWARERTIVCGSFSKKYAMTGYRVGFAYAPEGILYHMLKVHDALAICAPAISQLAAIAALKGPQTSVKTAVRRLAENRKAICRELDALSDILTYEKPMGAYYILAKLKRPNTDSFRLVLKILREASVVVIPGGAFGPTGEGHIRFSFAGKPEEIKTGMRRFRAWAKKWKKENYAL